MYFYSPELMAEYPATNRKEPVKSLKKRPSVIKPIDIVLRGSVVTGFVSPACNRCRELLNSLIHFRKMSFGQGHYLQGVIQIVNTS